MLKLLKEKQKEFVKFRRLYPRVKDSSVMLRYLLHCNRLQTSCHSHSKSLHGARGFLFRCSQHLYEYVYMKCTFIFVF